jgi:hypothetical protein
MSAADRGDISKATPQNAATIAGCVQSNVKDHLAVNASPLFGIRGASANHAPPTPLVREAQRRLER